MLQTSPELLHSNSRKQRKVDSWCSVPIVVGYGAQFRLPRVYSRNFKLSQLDICNRHRVTCSEVQVLVPYTLPCYRASLPRDDAWMSQSIAKIKTSRGIEAHRRCIDHTGRGIAFFY